MKVNNETVSAARQAVYEGVYALASECHGAGHSMLDGEGKLLTERRDSGENST